jgi:hypothetical protein
MSNSVFTEKLREHLAFTMVGLTLAALGTVASLSLSYIITFHDAAQSQYRKIDAAFSEFTARSPRGLAFLGLAVETRDRSGARSEILLKILNHEGGTSPGNLRKVYESGLRETMLDLATLSGYSPETTGLPARFHDTVQSELRAEVEYWRSVGRNLSSLENGRLSPAAAAELRARLLDSEFARRAATSAVDDMEFYRNLQRQAFEQRREDMKFERDRAWRWYNWSFVGLFVAILGFYFMLRLTIPFFASGTTLARAPEADLAAKGSIANKYQTGQYRPASARMEHDGRFSPRTR